MGKVRFVALAMFVVASCGGGLIAPQAVYAQVAGGLGGVLVDPEGVLKVRAFHDPGGRLLQERIAAAKAALDQDIVRPSRLRKVSITRLEAALRECLDNNRQPTDAMRNLAGLTRIQYVFYYPDTKDIVVAGPAEGWVKDVTGRTIGIQTGQPIVELQDLIVALRAHAPDKRGRTILGCSIDPTPEGLQRMQQFISGLHGIVPSDAPRIAQGLRTSLGLQDVVILGVSPKTHFAQVLVEADYRMKLIGIGLERPAVKIVSYVDKANPASVAKNAMQRWYFVPNYECVRTSDDALAMEMVGNGVQLLGEDQLVGADGSHRASGRVSRASTLFTKSFTRMYPKLAARSPVWAQLRNLIDMSVVAAHIRGQGYYDMANWDLGVFGDEASYPVETYTTPVRVETAVNVIWKKNTLMTPIGGGVRIEPALALSEDNRLEDEGGLVQKARTDINPAEVDSKRWWWD